MATQIERSDAEQYIERLSSDFTFFFQELWLDRGLHRFHQLTIVELDIADWAANGPRSRGILAPRGLFKTHLICGLSAYRWRRDPDRKIVVASKAHPHAKKIIALSRRWLDRVWFLQDLAPTSAQDDNKTQFQLGPARGDSLQPSMSAFGIEGMLEGNRGHTIVGDDVETKANTKTIEARDDLDERVKEFTDIRYPHIPFDQGGPIDPVETIMVGTYHNLESLYIKMNTRWGGHAFRTWPLVAPHPDDRIMNLAPLIKDMLREGILRPSTATFRFDGSPVFPLRFNEENIAEKKAEGMLRFAMQHMLICNVAESDQALKLSQLIVMDVDRNAAPLTVTYGTQDHNGTTAIEDIPSFGLGQDRLYRPIAIDKQRDRYHGTKARIDIAGVGDDKTGIAIVSSLNGFLWTHWVEGIPGGKDTATMDYLASTCRKYGATEIKIESNIDIFNTFHELFEAACFRHFLEPGQNPAYPDGWKCSVEKTHSPGSAFKEERILEALEPVLSTHRMVIAPDAIRPRPGEKLEHTLQYQITRMRRIRKCLKEDGQIDAWAGCVADWGFSLRVNPESQAETYRDAEIDEASRQIQALCAGIGPQQTPSFIRW